MSSTNIIIQHRVEEKTGIIKLNNPEVLNALSIDFLKEIYNAVKTMDDDSSINCIILTGNERAFAAGADISSLADKGPVDILNMDMYGVWSSFKNIKKPVIAAVSGFALGGGCELAMICDIILAGENAKFGQPEINLGIMPGAGGTQRLPRLVGKHKAMEMVLTGNFISSSQALQIGMINKVVPDEMLMYEAELMAKQIASKSAIAVQMAKESILRSFEMPLNDGLLFERRNYMTCFDTPEQKDNMKAFLNKKK